MMTKTQIELFYAVRAIEQATERKLITALKHYNVQQVAA